MILKHRHVCWQDSTPATKNLTQPAQRCLTNCTAALGVSPKIHISFLITVLSINIIIIYLFLSIVHWVKLVWSYYFQLTNTNLDEFINLKIIFLSICLNAFAELSQIHALHNTYNFKWPSVNMLYSNRFEVEFIKE